jgi:hypothetical protein
MATDNMETPASEESQPSGQNAVRGAFLRHQALADALTGEHVGDITAETVRDAYLSRLARETRRTRGEVVAGSEDTGGAVLRGIYAARTAAAVPAGRPGPRPAPARKAKPKAKAAPTAKRRAAAPKKARAAAARPKARAAKRTAKGKARRR